MNPLLLRLARRPSFQRMVTLAIKQLSRLGGIDLHALGLHERGILNYRNAEESGEAHLMHTVLPELARRAGPGPHLFLDVGANEGSYARALARLDLGPVHAFEPNPATFAVLRQNTSGLANVQAHGFGLGAEAAESVLHEKAGGDASSHASLYPEVLASFHRYEETNTVPVTLRTLDDFAAEQRMAEIFFIKIDTEGHELSVLQGARSLLGRNAIKAIQFEFNEMNVASRTFLRDFFRLLPAYRFFRLLPDHLAPLTYSPREEIFQFQNILALHADLQFQGIGHPL